MTPDLAALYRAICAEPDEDTPRLAFADMLEEEGNAERAAFIRDQITLARFPEYDPLHIRTRQANPDAAYGWCRTDDLPPIPVGSGWHRFEFRRGFPWKAAVLSLPELVRSGESVFAAAPLQAFDIDARSRTDLGLLADWPLLSRVRRLDFSLGRLGADAIARLADSPHAAHLSELAFVFDGLSPEGLEALAASPLFARLEAFELQGCVIPPALLVDALAAATEPGNLSRLSLSDNAIAGADAPHLFALPVLHGLQRLDLSDNRQLGVAGVCALAESGVLRGLKELRLGRTLPGTTGVRSLVEANGLGSLRSLDLSGNRLGPVAVKLIAESALARGLRVLNLSGNPLGDRGAVVLARAPLLSGLLELDLADTDLTEVGALALAESPYLGDLLRLNLTTRDATARRFGPVAREVLTRRFGRAVQINPAA